MTFHIITLFPSMFDAYVNESILGRAQKEKKIKFKFYNPRDYVRGKFRKVWPDGNVSSQIDDKPYGGGPGMVMRAEPVLAAVKKIKATLAKKNVQPKIIITSPGGIQFTNEYAKKTTKKFSDVIIICGRYEGLDDRVRKALRAQEVSIGDFILTGGEVPAMAMVDAMARQIPGVLGSFDSVEESRTASHQVYTRPEILEYEGKRYKVPPVLVSGDHAKIEKWRAGHDN